jgi:hypothetical protein
MYVEPGWPPAACKIARILTMQYVAGGHHGVFQYCEAVPLILAFLGILWPVFLSFAAFLTLLWVCADPVWGAALQHHRHQQRCGPPGARGHVPGQLQSLHSISLLVLSIRRYRSHFGHLGRVWTRIWGIMKLLVRICFIRNKNVSPRCSFFGKKQGFFYEFFILIVRRLRALFFKKLLY